MKIRLYGLCMDKRAQFDSWYGQLVELDARAADDHTQKVAEASQLADAVATSALPIRAKSALLFMCSSIVLNCAFELKNPSILSRGRELAEQAVTGTTPSEPLYFQCRYNLANALTSLCDLGLPIAASGEDDWETRRVRNRIETRADLQEARRLFFEVGSSEVADHRSRSAAFCNLANILDHSGRWAEAYDFYLRALEIDPRNGNAAGNLAHLLHTRIGTGIGQTGHIAAVYDKYVALAQQLREGTLEFAAAAVADRWDQLPLSESQGHLSHGLDDLEARDGDYRRWVAQFRLALSPAVEGLGADDLRWDSAAIEVLYGETAEEMNPPILAAMNVLKSDFLVSRRLAFDALVDLAEGLEQTEDDSGLYTETLDHSLYGIQYSKLLLAQRSALDVLDKTAVVANEHFAVGDTPRKVTFRAFWADKAGQLRQSLVKAPERALPNLALAELAADMEKTGMYGASQALRNAGTHRIVHAAQQSATGVTEDSRSRIDLIELVDSTVLALQVTRSAYLYLIDLVAMWNHPEDHQETYRPFPGLSYQLDPTSKDKLSDPNDHLGATPSSAQS